MLFFNDGHGCPGGSAINCYVFTVNEIIFFLTKEQIAQTGADTTDIEGITSLPRNIEGVQVGITIRQQPAGSYKVSVRTVPEVDAAEICAHLGGGGHRQAAGCELLGSLDNAKSALLTEVEKALCKE